jgi:hypothetical protein
MKKINISLSYDEEKYNALKLFFSQKNQDLEREMEAALDLLYRKNVPAEVRKYIGLKSGNTEKKVKSVRADDRGDPD